MGNREDNKGFTGTQPSGVTATLLQSQTAAPRGKGARSGPESTPPATAAFAADSCHWLLPGRLPGRRGGKQTHTLLPRGNVHGKAPTLSLGRSQTAGDVAARGRGRAARRLGSALGTRRGTASQQELVYNLGFSASTAHAT